MITYSTKFPVNDSLTKNEFINTIIKWNQGSKYDKINPLMWDGVSFEYSWKQENISLSIQEISDKEIVASRLKKEDEHGVWLTDFILDRINKMISISVSLETTEFTTDFFPTYYPPYFVKLIVFGKYSGNDNGIMVLNQVHSILECADFFKGIVNKTLSSTLPVVYVARNDAGENPLDINNLAFRLQGVAHVLFEPEEGVELEGFSDVLDDKKSRSGKLFIYYPNHNKKSRIFNMNGVNQTAEYLEDRVVNDIYNYMNSRMRKSIETWDGVLNEKLHIENTKLLSNQSAIKAENNELYEIFGEQLEKTEELNFKLNNEVQRLTAELQGLRMRYSEKNKNPILFLGDEKEFYTDEIKEIILDIIFEYQKKCQKDTRRWHIISDLLESNEFKGLSGKRKEQIKAALKGYRTLNSSLKGLLETLGIKISSDGKHYKGTYYGDHRYVATVAKTCSDVRAGMNISSTIEKIML